jgi:hypothetical protein
MSYQVDAWVEEGTVSSPHVDHLAGVECTLENSRRVYILLITANVHVYFFRRVAEGFRLMISIDTSPYDMRRRIANSQKGPGEYAERAEPRVRFVYLHGYRIFHHVPEYEYYIGHPGTVHLRIDYMITTMLP